MNLRSNVLRSHQGVYLSSSGALIQGLRKWLQPVRDGEQSS